MNTINMTTENRAMKISVKNEDFSIMDSSHALVHIC